MRAKGDEEAVAAAREQFWDLCGPLLARDDTEEGTIMSSKCLRVNGEFVAMVVQSGQMVAKLPAARVQELVADGVGEPFAPAKKVFKEWVALVTHDEDLWQSVLDESHSWVGDL
jgi:hypothetical protein